MTFWLLALLGAGGAFCYAAGTLGLKVFDAATPREKLRAAIEFLIQLVTGALAAACFSPTAQALVENGVSIGSTMLKANIHEVPIALTLGWVSNYLWPKILRKLGEAVDKGIAVRTAE